MQVTTKSISRDGEFPKRETSQGTDVFPTSPGPVALYPLTSRLTGLTKVTSRRLRKRSFRCLHAALLWRLG
jgi:hypothetical protein